MIFAQSLSPAWPVLLSGPTCAYHVRANCAPNKSFGWYAGKCDGTRVSAVLKLVLLLIFVLPLSARQLNSLVPQSTLTSNTWFVAEWRYLNSYDIYFDCCLMKLLRNFFPVKKYMKKFEAALRIRRKFDMTSRYSVQKAGPHIPGDVSDNQVHSI